MGFGGKPGSRGAVQFEPNGVLSLGKIGKPGMDGFVKLNMKGVPASHPREHVYKICVFCMSVALKRPCFFALSACPSTHVSCLATESCPMLRHCVMQAPRSAGPRAISDGGLKGDVGAPPSPVLPNSPLPSEPPSSVPRCDVKPNIHVLGDDTGIPGMELSVQLNMNGMPAAHPCMHDADMLCLAASNLSASVPFEPPREEEVDDKEEEDLKGIVQEEANIWQENREVQEGEDGKHNSQLV